MFALGGGIIDLINSDWLFGRVH